MFASVDRRSVKRLREIFSGRISIWDHYTDIYSSAIVRVRLHAAWHLRASTAKRAHFPFDLARPLLRSCAAACYCVRRYSIRRKTTAHLTAVIAAKALGGADSAAPDFSQATTLLRHGLYIPPCNGVRTSYIKQNWFNASRTHSRAYVTVL